VELNEQQSVSLRNQGYINRACRECVGITRWEMHAAPESAPPPSSLPFAGCRGRILVIDDDIDVLTVLTKGLAKQKFDVVAADSAREALTMLARADFDVVVSDIHMPEFDARQLMQFLDEHLPDYKERVVFISGDTGTPETMEFVAQQRRPFVPKPLDMPTLLEAIRPFLRESAGFVPYEEAVVVAAVEPVAEPKPASSERTSEEKSATEEALSYAVITLRGELKSLKRTLDERNAEVEALRRELAGRETDGRRRFDEMYQEQERLRAESTQKAQEAAGARTELEQVQQQLEQLRSQVERLKPDTTAAEREKEFARREAELQKELREAAKTAQQLEQEAATLRQQAVAAEAQVVSARREQEAAVPQREQAEADAERWRKAAEEAGAEAERARRDLAVAYGRHETETTELRNKAVEAQSEMGKMMAELQQAQVDVVAKAQEELKQTREAMQQAGRSCSGRRKR
jgi:DNA-binding NarL/FixJ family response regulator